MSHASGSKYLGFRVQDVGFRVQYLGFRIQGLALRVSGLAFKVEGSGWAWALYVDITACWTLLEGFGPSCYF